MDKIKVVMINDIYLPDIDGTVNATHNLLLNSYKLFEGLVIAPNHNNYIDEFPYKVARVKSIKLPCINSRLASPKNDKTIIEVLDEYKPDIIHINTPFALGKFAVKYAKEHNIPVVATLHNDFSYNVKRIVKSEKLTKIIMKKLAKVYNNCDRVLVVSDKVKDIAVKNGITTQLSPTIFGVRYDKTNDKTRLIQKANEKFSLTDDDNVFLYVGRLVKLKRIDFTLDMLRELSAKGEKFKFFIVGNGEYENNLKAKVNELGLNDNVIFTGILDGNDLQLLYARANLFLFPSIYDTYGLVKDEAAAFMTPTLCVIDTNPAFGIVDGVNGYLCEDDLYAYADKVQEILCDKEKMLEVGKAAQETFYHTWRDACKDLLVTYQDIIKEYKNNNE